MDAELARVKLEASGLKVFVAADNCGGMRPHLQVATGIRLMIREEDVERAEDILSKSEELALPDNFLPPEVAPTEETRPINKRTLLTWSTIGVIVIIFVILFPKISYFISAIVNAPNYEFVLKSQVNDAATLAKLKEVISARLKASEIIYKLESISEGRFKLGVMLTAKTSANSVRSLVQRRGVLEFRLVHKKNDNLIKELFEKHLVPEGYQITVIGNQKWYQRNRSIPDTDMAYENTITGFNVPDRAYEFMLARDERDGNTVYRPYFVHRRAVITGKYLKDSSVVVRGFTPVIAISFDSKGASIFARIKDITTRRQLAIVLDGTLYMAPVINEAIYGGKADISGEFTFDEAKLLATILRAGVLPCTVEIVNEHRLSKNR